MSHVATLFDRIVEDIGEAGQQLTALAALEGSAGNISVFVSSLSCPFEPVDDLELPSPAASLAGGWVEWRPSWRGEPDARCAAQLLAVDPGEQVQRLGGPTELADRTAEAGGSLESFIGTARPPHPPAQIVV